MSGRKPSSVGISLRASIPFTKKLKFTSCELGVGRRQDSAFPSSSPGWPKKPHWTKPIASISAGAREQDGRSHSVCGHCFGPPRCEKGTKRH